MKALTLTQPWATLVALGEKSIETRSWPTQYRGLLAIHAAKCFRKSSFKHDGIFNQEPFRSSLRPSGNYSYPELDAGNVLCVCRLCGCSRTEDIMQQIGGLESFRKEAEFGNYAPRRYGFSLALEYRVKPVAVNGHLGLWEIDDSLLVRA